MLQLGTWRVQCTFLKIDYIFFFISNCALVLLSAVYLQLVMNKSHVTLSYLFYAFLFVFIFSVKKLQNNANLEPDGHYRKIEPAAKLCMQMYQIKFDFQ